VSQRGTAYEFNNVRTLLAGATVRVTGLPAEGGGRVRTTCQSPLEAIHRALAWFLHVPLNASGNAAQWAIVATFSMGNVRDLHFAGTIGYGEHGVASAT